MFGFLQKYIFTISVLQKGIKALQESCFLTVEFYFNVAGLVSISS